MTFDKNKTFTWTYCLYDNCPLNCKRKLKQWNYSQETLNLLHSKINLSYYLNDEETKCKLLIPLDKEITSDK